MFPIVKLVAVILPLAVISPVAVTWTVSRIVNNSLIVPVAPPDAVTESPATNSAPDPASVVGPI